VPHPAPPHSLTLTRDLDLPPAALWRAYTEPELLMQWFCPRPWRVTACELDVRPGGAFSNTMEGPDGERAPHTGCYLEATPDRRLVWTSALLPGYVPAPPPPPGGFHMTAIIDLTPLPDNRTRYEATVVHADAEACAAHEAMGFYVGWGLALDQLVELMTSQPA
jgi:uncharacterized protein YndB with AHSA1/START domain